MSTAPGKTMSEKILSSRSGTDARAGDVVVCSVDLAIATDGSGPMTIDYFEAMGGTRVFDPERVIFSRDHYAPPATLGAVRLHDRMVAFSEVHGVQVLDVGEGISFQVACQQGAVLPGSVVVGADSHTVMGGALNAFCTGVGSSDLAATLVCGTIWLRVPETIRVTLRGALASWVQPKDVVLELLQRLGADGANYRTLEFLGPGVESLGMDDRMVLSNMSVEMGAKAGLFEADEVTASYLHPRTGQSYETVRPDEDATYVQEIDVDLGAIGPGVSLPHSPDNVVPVKEVAGAPVDMVFVGTCTGGRVRDFHQVLEWIRRGGGRLHPGVQLVLTPVSREVLLELERDGTIAELVQMGAMLTTPGCGPCCGTSGPIPGDDATVLSTANRNFKARMGNETVDIYLSSPVVCAVSAVTGRITDPGEVGGDGDTA